MKSKYLYRILILSTLLFVSCLDKDFKISTIIYPNGSCERILKARHYSHVKFENFPVIIDSTWQLTILTDTSVDGKTDTFNIYKKLYRDVKSVNREFADTGYFFSSIERGISLKKKFRWFYSIFEYEETYGKLFEGNPLSGLLSEEEILYTKNMENGSLKIFCGLDSLKTKSKKDSIDKIYNKWMAETMFNNYYSALLDEVKGNSDLAEYSTNLKLKKDTIFNWFLKMEKDIEDVFYYTDTVLGTNGQIVNLLGNDSGPVNDFMKRKKIWENMIIGCQVLHTLEIPGNLKYSNADSIVNNILFYNVTWDKFFTTNYNMNAETRIKNIWAYYISGTIILLIFVMIIFLRKKAER